MQVAKAIQDLCSRTLSKQNGALSMNWIQGVPLYSFLTERSEPYDDVWNISGDKLIQNWLSLFRELKISEARRHIKADNLMLVH